MADITAMTTEEAVLDALLADLGLPNDEIAADATGGSSLEALTELEMESAAPITVAEVHPESEAAIEEEKPTAKHKKPEKKTKEPKAPKSPKEPKPKKEKVERKHYASLTERVTDKLGAALGDYAVLELTDATLEGEALKAKQAETMSIFKSASKKAQGFMTIFMEFAAGKTANVNAAMLHGLQTLKADGKLTAGNEGNLYKALLAHPYNPGTARAMEAYLLNAMTKFKMVAKTEKGTYLPNENSLYLLKLNSMLGV